MSSSNKDRLRDAGYALNGGHWVLIGGTTAAQEHDAPEEEKEAEEV